MLRISRHAGHQSRHELDGIMTLEICRLVRDDSIRGRVRLVEGVRSECHHVFEYDFGR